MSILLLGLVLVVPATAAWIAGALDKMPSDSSLARWQKPEMSDTFRRLTSKILHG
jgi:NADH:ubiquinone oxidoreductase subunit